MRLEVGIKSICGNRFHLHLPILEVRRVTSGYNLETAFSYKESVFARYCNESPMQVEHEDAKHQKVIFVRIYQDEVEAAWQSLLGSTSRCMREAW
jgi:hypothetical protein